MYPLIAASFLLLCLYFFFDGLNNPEKYKPMTFDGDMFPIGAAIDQPNAEFHVANAVIDTLLVDDCVSAMKALGIKMSKRQAEDIIISNNIETTEDFIRTHFQKTQ